MEKIIRICDNCKKEATTKNPVNRYSVRRGSFTADDITIDLCNECVNKISIKTILSRKYKIKELEEIK